MEEIIEFLKQRRNVKYSLWIIVFGLIFAFTFQANRAQIFQILEKPIRIVPGTKEAEQYLVSGWQGSRAKGKRSVFIVSLPERKTYQMVVKAFSCSPPDARDQRVEVHFNDVALDRLKFRKTPKWQKFRINIYSYLLQETNTIKFVYTQNTRLFPTTFDYLEFRNYTARLKGLYLLFDQPFLRRPEVQPLFLQLFFGPASRPPLKKVSLHSEFKAFSFSLTFIILLWAIWLFYSRFLSFAIKIKLFRATRIDFFSYFPSIILLSLLALISFFSSYHFVYSRKAFFVLALTPVVTLKLFPYTGLFCRFLLRTIEKTYVEVKKTLSFLKIRAVTFRKLLIRYHKTNLSSAFILDFMLLLVLCAFLLIIKGSIAAWIADRIASFAYILLVIGVIMKIVQLVQKEKAGDEKRFIRIKIRWKVPFKKIILRIKKRDKVPFKKTILGLVSILLVLLFLWLILPGKGVEVSQLIPQETFTFLILKIDLEDPGTSELINNFDWRIRWGVRLLGPMKVAALATPAVSKEEPDYLFLVKNSRLIKIARLFRRSINRAIIDGEPFERIDYRGCRILHLLSSGKEDEVSSYTLFRDVAFASNNLSLLKASLDQSGQETSFISGEALSDFRELQSSGEALFFLNNSHSELSRALKSLEEKSAYAILPTVDSLNYLRGYFDILDADSLKGSLLFKYRETVDIKKGQEDIYFLAGLLKRLCRANGLNFEEEIIVDNHSLKLDFKLSGLKSVINNLLAKEKK